MKLPILSSKEVVEVLREKGFNMTRQSGSHMIFVKHDATGKITVVVPKHRELAKDTLLNIIAQSKMSKEEFLKLLK